MILTYPYLKKCSLYFNVTIIDFRKANKKLLSSGNNLKKLTFSSYLKNKFNFRKIGKTRKLTNNPKEALRKIEDLIDEMNKEQNDN